MHPSELKNQALVAAAMAEREGFTATAEAYKLLARSCATEARELLSASASLGWLHRRHAAQDGFQNFEVIR